jgi:hypothetical protein
MQPGSSEHVNLRLDNAQWISTDADRTYFNRLVAQIEGMRRTDEQLSIPDVDEPFAWRRAFSLRSALQVRDRQMETKAAADLQLASQAAEMNRLWIAYNENITWLREFEGRNRGEWKTLIEWVGLSEDGLSDPVPRAGSEHAQYGRHPDWQARAGRVSTAVNKFRGLSPEQRAEVPRIVEERRRLAILKAHDTDIINIREVLSHILQRLEAIESRLPSQAEIREAADAVA